MKIYFFNFIDRIMRLCCEKPNTNYGILNNNIESQQSMDNKDNKKNNSTKDKKDSL